MAKKFTDRVKILEMNEDIYSRHGGDVKSVNFLKFNRKYRLLKDATAVRYAYIRYLKREKGLELDPWSGQFLSKRVCDNCRKKVPKLFRFKGRDICDKCLNPEMEPPKFSENSSPIGYFEYKGM